MSTFTIDDLAPRSPGVFSGPLADQIGSIEEAIEVARQFQAQGYTPRISWPRGTSESDAEIHIKLAEAGFVHIFAV